MFQRGDVVRRIGSSTSEVINGHEYYVREQRGADLYLQEITDGYGEEYFELVRRAETVPKKFFVNTTSFVEYLKSKGVKYA